MTNQIIKLTLIEEYEDAIATAFPECTCSEGSCFHCYYKQKIVELHKEIDDANNV
jgi:hypothetical protein